MPTTQLDEPAIESADVATASSPPAKEAGSETGERMAAPAPALRDQLDPAPAHHRDTDEAAACSPGSAEPR